MTRLQKRKIRRCMTKIHDAVIKTITWIAAFVFMFSLCAVDDPVYGMFFLKVAVACGAWIALFCYVNGYFYNE